MAVIPQATLEGALKYHVVAGTNKASTDLTNNLTLSTLQGSTLKITNTGSVKITDKYNRVSNVTTADIQCSNGIIHGIDKVLLP